MKSARLRPKCVCQKRKIKRLKFRQIQKVKILVEFLPQNHLRLNIFPALKDRLRQAMVVV